MTLMIFLILALLVSVINLHAFLITSRLGPNNLIKCNIIDHMLAV